MNTAHLKSYLEQVTPLFEAEIEQNNQSPVPISAVSIQTIIEDLGESIQSLSKLGFTREEVHEILTLGGLNVGLGTFKAYTCKLKIESKGLRGRRTVEENERLKKVKENVILKIKENLKKENHEV